MQEVYAQKIIDLKICRNQKQMDMFVTRLKQYVNQNSIIITQCDLGYNSAYAISKNIVSNKHLQNIQKLCLDNNCLKDKGVSVLS